jgi:hypothetical protein
MYQLIKALQVTKAYAVTFPSNLAPPATGTNPCGSIFSTGGFGGPAHAGWDCLGAYVINLTQVVIGAAGTLSLIMLMINGFRYMYGPAIPGGSSDAAKKGIGAALLGLAISLLTYIILDTIVSSVTQ